jgi:hypothetical protein
MAASRMQGREGKEESSSFLKKKNQKTFAL